MPQIRIRLDSDPPQIRLEGFLCFSDTILPRSSGPFKEQEFDYDATVVERLHAAGAVCVAKLTTGELAGGDHWFGGQTMNPWNPHTEGSSGSSAGPGSATAAGCVGFSIGTETSGSSNYHLYRCCLNHGYIF